MESQFILVAEDSRMMFTDNLKWESDGGGNPMVFTPEAAIKFHPPIDSPHDYRWVAYIDADSRGMYIDRSGNICQPTVN